VTPEVMAEACSKSDLIAPSTMFKALRMLDELDTAPDYKVNGLSALPEILSANRD
jgi:2-haloacid dehalogenase